MLGAEGVARGDETPGGAQGGKTHHETRDVEMRGDLHGARQKVILKTVATSLNDPQIKDDPLKIESAPLHWFSEASSPEK